MSNALWPFSFIPSTFLFYRKSFSSYFCDILGIKPRVVSVEKPIHISNVSLVEDGKPAKIKFEVVDGKKVRVFKKTGNKVGN